MSTKEISNVVEIKTTSMLKPASNVSQIATREYVKLMEIAEYCKIAESNLKELEQKIELLTITNQENLKLRDEYLTRNKINIINSESLRQARNELYKYKCELKSDYIIKEEAVKSKRIKYEKIIFSYESEWIKTLKQYESNPVMVEYNEIQEENDILEKEIERIDKLARLTKNQFYSLQQSIEENFYKKIVEFSEQMLSYNKTCEEYLKVKKEKKALEVTEKQVKIRIFTNDLPLFQKNNSEYTNKGVNIDMSHFDNIVVPTESLEKLSEEELFSFYSINSNPEYDNNSDNFEAESMTYDFQEVENSQKNEICEISEPNENESQYFQTLTSKDQLLYHTQQQQLNTSKCNNWSHAKKNLVRLENYEKEDEGQIGNVAKKFKPSNNEVEDQKELTGSKNEKEISRLDSEENLSNGSSENKFGNPLENKTDGVKKTGFLENEGNVENEFRNNSSSFEEALTPISVVSPEEVSKSPVQPFLEEQISNDNLNDDNGKDTFKSFGGFFFGNSGNSPKPSIFKLF